VVSSDLFNSTNKSKKQPFWFPCCQNIGYLSYYKYTALSVTCKSVFCDIPLDQSNCFRVCSIPVVMIPVVEFARDIKCIALVSLIFA
jgi:hypothetical protein